MDCLVCCCISYIDRCLTLLWIAVWAICLLQTCPQNQKQTDSLQSSFLWFHLVSANPQLGTRGGLPEGGALFSITLHHLAITYWNVWDGSAKIDAIFCEEDGAWDKVESTAHHISCRESGAISLASGWRTEHTTIISMIAIRVLFPAWQPVQVDPQARQTYSHVTIPSLADDTDFKVVHSTSSWNMVWSSHTSSIFMVTATS